MPGPMSDSYDPEWGTSSKAAEIREALAETYDVVSEVLRNSPPMDIRKLVDADLPKIIGSALTERQWRLIRFSLERAKESI